jgi:hypothetical protein
MGCAISATLLRAGAAEYGAVEIRSEKLWEQAHFDFDGMIAFGGSPNGC